MWRRILSILTVLTLFAGLLSGCTGHKDPDKPTGATTSVTGNSTSSVSGETDATEEGTTADETAPTDENGETLVPTEETPDTTAPNGETTAATGDNGKTNAPMGNDKTDVSDTTNAADKPTTGNKPTTAPKPTAGNKTSANVQKPTAKPTEKTTRPTSQNQPTPPADNTAYQGIKPGSTEAGTPFSTLAKAPKDNAVTVKNDTKQFGRFLLTTSDNKGLPFNVACHISGDRITAVVPADTDLTKIKANFTYYGKDVTYKGAPLTSRATELDLTSDATLTLNAKDGSSKNMTVHVEKLATGLPSMSLTTSGYAAVNSTTDYKNASFSIGGGDKSVCGYATSSQLKGADCSIKGRGNTSWTYDKKCYTLRFDTKYEMLGLPETKNLVLLAMYSDGSLMRYRLGEYLSEKVGLEFTMNMRYVDLWLNGEYLGVYALVEKIEVEKNHVGITDYVSASTPVNQMGYLLEFDDHLYTNASEAQRAKWQTVGKGFHDPAINETFFYLNVLGPDWLTIRTTNAKSITANHVNYIYAVVNQAMLALKSGDWNKINACIDVESFINWYLIEEYLNNTDSDMTSSVYMYIDVGGKLKLGPLWDLDNCAGNHTATASATAHALYDSQNGWFSYLFKCKEAKAMLKTQWGKMKGTLSGVSGVIDQTATMLDTAASLNFTRWATLGKKLPTQPAAVGQADTYQKQVKYLKDYLATRQKSLDSFYSNL